MIQHGADLVCDGYPQRDSRAKLDANACRADMHALAESGEAAHTAYKGGLRPQQARRLRFWAQHSLELRSTDRPGGWTSSEEAARELFR